MKVLAQSDSTPQAEIHADGSSVAAVLSAFHELSAKADRDNDQEVEVLCRPM